MEPYWAEAYLHLGAAYQGAGHPREALDAYVEFTQRAPRRYAAAVARVRTQIAALRQVARRAGAVAGGPAEKPCGGAARGASSGGTPHLLSPPASAPMDRAKLIAIAALAAVLVFLVGYLPQHSRAGKYREQLAEARHELKFARLQGRLGAAVTEGMRGNYERARQLMADFFTDLQGAAGEVTDARQRQAIGSILAQRDELITLLSRAQPESTQRLMLLYTTYYAAMDPAGRASPPPVTPPPPPAAPARPQAEKAPPAKR